MPFPSFYDPDRIGLNYRPDTERAISAGLAAGLAPAEHDDPTTLLLLVDPQVDFIHTDGALSVPGAVEDTRRTIEWLYAHAGEVSAIAASLDSHVPLQIFYPTWWRDQEGRPPKPYTTITGEQVEAGTWRPTRLPAWSVAYVRQLETRSKKQLMIWPYHTMVGSPGHDLTPALYEAIMYHAAARQTQPRYVHKGSLPQTEYYSLLEPEVKVPDDAGGQTNVAFFNEMMSFDRVYIAGQAKSHCVLETLLTVDRLLGDDRPAMGKMHLLEDCTSSVQHPDIDFDSMATESLDRLAARGLHRLTSADPLD